MAAKDHHIALRSDTLAQANAGQIDIRLVKLQWGKEDFAFTVHVTSVGGAHMTDWLKMLGFMANEQCQFSTNRRCFSKEVPEGFDIQQSATAFNEGFGALQKAEAALQACGFWPPWGRRMSDRALPYHRRLAGDGHNAISSKVMNSTEDGTFAYKFTFIDTGREKGFVTHYRPLHPPLSSEVQSVFKYLGLQEFEDCPEFDFDPCYYRTLRLYENDNPFDGNVDFAHQSFNAHATRFAPAIEALLAANSAAERVNLSVLPIARPAERLKTDIIQQIRKPTNPKPKLARTSNMDAVLPAHFDVAISFAGTERELAEKLAEIVRAAGFSVFYDNFYPEQLWGKNLTAFLDEIYRKRAKFCVVLVSADYAERKWTNHELRSAQAKALEQKGDEYILPIKVDNTELDGLPPNIGYLDLSLGVDEIAELLVKKLQA
ncbi:hypothetical protein ACVIWU_001569 [Bradyrhizobium sp. USDA 4509]